MAKNKVKIPAIARSDYTNANRLIHLGPCIVKAVHVAADGINGYCEIYDGVNASGKLKAHIEVLAGMSRMWRPGAGTDFDFGIYIIAFDEVDGNTTKVTVTYNPESRKRFI